MSITPSTSCKSQDVTYEDAKLHFDAICSMAPGQMKDPVMSEHFRKKADEMEEKAARLSDNELHTQEGMSGRTPAQTREWYEGVIRFQRTYQRVCEEHDRAAASK